MSPIGLTSCDRPTLGSFLEPGRIGREFLSFGIMIGEVKVIIYTMEFRDIPKYIYVCGWVCKELYILIISNTYSEGVHKESRERIVHLYNFNVCSLPNTTCISVKMYLNISQCFLCLSLYYTIKFSFPFFSIRIIFSSIFSTA